MFELLRGAAAIIVSGYIYMVLGMVFIRKREISLTAALLTGFFAYFAILQFLAVPMVLSKRPLHELTVCWGIVIALLTVFGSIYCTCKKYSISKFDWRKQKGILLAVGIIFAAMLYYALRYGYVGFDASYYIGTVNTSLYTDSMYIFDGNSGVKNGFLELRYALSSFYMNSAVRCQIFKLSALVEMRLITGFFCVSFFYMILFQIGKTWFQGDDRKALLVAGTGGIICFFFRSAYTPAQFLLCRSYEAKAYCANVVLPMLFCTFLYLWKNKEDKQIWKLIFLICLSCNAISMSCILIVPVMLSVYSLFLLVTCKNKNDICIRYLVCMVPCMVYVITYVLYLKGFIQIKV